jgi:hypothetical protein
MGEYTTGMGQTLSRVHEDGECHLPGACPIHCPSGHHMREWPTAWSSGQMWRVCEHGALHPDPDDSRGFPDPFALWESITSVAFSHPEDCSCVVCCTAAADPADFEATFAKMVPVVFACRCECRCCEHP